MTRHQAFALLLLSACLLIPTALAPALAAPPAVTEKVNCHKGESINKALAKHSDAASLVVEISGLCKENVVVTRDRVTLRGADPATDGIEAIANVEQTDAAVWVRSAQLVTVENLKLTGGFSGLLATEVSVPHLRVNNCRMEGNVQWGAQLELALLVAEDTTFGPNERFSVGVFAGSRFECHGCTLTLSPTSTVRDNLFVLSGSQALMFDSALVNGGVNSGNSGVNFTDSSIEAFPGAVAVLAGGSSNVGLARTQVEGPMRFFASTTAGLFGVVQTHGTATGPVPNSADDAAFVKIGNAAPACPSPPCAPAPPVPSSVLGFNLSNFSNASLLQTSTVTGNFNCTLGANAVCPTPANVSGTANCGLCTKP
ncbi:MAG TPA: hypothetical protein VFS10_16370 [Pyrinomonadaceae bacterium]|nr:hypothetical protein [Pyrinomonadaceae bacterium]